MPQVDQARLERWQSAHAGEAQFWLRLPEEEFVRQAEGYARLASQILHFYRALLDPRERFRALQIGCGVEDVIFHLPEGELFAVDPLADFYKAHFERSRSPRVDYRNAMGEDIPHDAGFFNIVICQNVMDQCADCRVVMQEIVRVLAEPHLLVFATDVYSEVTAARRWEADRRGEIHDVNHPHTFTERTLDGLLVDHGLEVVHRVPRLSSGKGDDSWRHCVFATRQVSRA